MAFLLLERFGVKRLKLIWLALLALVVSGCAGVQYASSDQARLGPEPYRVGPVRVWLRPQEEVSFICRSAYPALVSNMVVRGCYIEKQNAIVSIPDPYVLLHEFKHHFEGRWH